QDGVDAGKLDEREHRRLHEMTSHGKLIRQRELRQLAAHHQARRDLGQRNARGFADVGNRAGSARVNFQHIHLAGLNSVLNVHQSHYAQLAGQLYRVMAERLELTIPDMDRREYAGTVAGMNPGFFDVLHNAGHHHVLTVCQSIHVNLSGVFQEPVHQDRKGALQLLGAADIVAQHTVIIGDHHVASAQHVRRSHQYRVTDAVRDLESLVDVHGGAVLRLRDAHADKQRPKMLAVFRQIDRFRSRADNGHPCGLELSRQIEWSLAAKLYNNTRGTFLLHDGHDVLEGERIKIEAIGSVVVCRDGLRIAIHHDRLIALFLEGECRVATAVIKLDSLADAVRPA